MTRSTGYAWRSVSCRFFFCFVLPYLVLLFHSFWTISLHFGESCLLHGSSTSLFPSYIPKFAPSCFSSKQNDSRSGLLLSSCLPVQADFQDQKLLSLSVEGNGNGLYHITASTPTTPPFVNTLLPGSPEISPTIRTGFT